MEILTEAELDFVAGGTPGPDDDPYHFPRKGSDGGPGGFGDGTLPPDFPVNPIVPPDLIFREDMYDKPPPDPDGPSGL